MAEVEKMSEAERRRRFRLCPVKCEMDRHVVRSLSDYFSVISGFVIGDAMYWFRGHEQPQWGLTPRALRPTKLTDRRRALDLIADFKRVAEAKLPRQIPIPAPDDHFKWAQIAQHYGLPTRLLDWTESATTALYFACLKPKLDGVVFVIKPTDLNGSGPLSEPRILDPEADASLILKFLRAGPRQPGRRSYPLAVNPIWNSERLIAQKGTFTLHGSLFSLDKARIPSLVAIPILWEHKHQLRAELRRIGVDEMTLFPELEHSCRHLTMWAKCSLLEFD